MFRKKKKEPMRATISIIPTGISYFEHPSQVAGWTNLLDLFEEEVFQTTRMINVLVSSEDNPNWSYYGLPRELANLPPPSRKFGDKWWKWRNNYTFPAYLPSTIFKGKRDGETIELLVNKTRVLFALTQIHSCKCYGSFHEIFNKLMEEEDKKDLSRDRSMDHCTKRKGVGYVVYH